MRIILICLLFLISGCQEKIVETPLAPALEKGELVVITRNAPHAFYIDSEGNYAGLEYDLVSHFAKSLNLKVRFTITPEFKQILPTVAKHKVHLAAAGLTVTSERRSKVIFGPIYQTAEQWVVYNTSLPKPRSAKDLIGKEIEVIAGSSYVESLQALKKKFPGLAWREVAKQEGEELIEKVAQGKVDYVIADSNILEIAKNYYPNIGAAFPIDQPKGVAWAFPKDTDKQFMQQIELFFKKIQQDGTLKRLQDRYYGHVNRLNTIDIEHFLANRNKVLPRYQYYFKQAEEQTGIDWRLLVSLGYQESHWDPYATSSFGVRGMMMLTNDTADRMGVTNRLDPEQSIRAGAQYLLKLKEILPARIAEPDRTWIALAAYNVGLGHLEDARILAQRLKKNPNAWADLKAVLPLLSRAEYFSTLRHGYARGGEPVGFVENIRTYHTILVRFEKPHQSVFPGLHENILVDNPADLKLGMSTP